MRKNLFGIIAIVLAVGFSAFNNRGKGKFTNTLYHYTGPSTQTTGSRETASNYTKVTSLTCMGSGDECIVTLNQDFGTTPDFTNVGFDSNGFPNSGNAFVANTQQAN